MDNQSMYMAQELTDEQIESIAKSLEHDAENLYGDNTKSFMDDENNAAAALRDYVRLRKENAQLKARLAAVVKECETEKSKWIPAMEYESIVKRSSMVDRYDRILSAARGGGSAAR